jgi:HPt (histidine-containing phosphotransfer) domain-containing protein
VYITTGVNSRAGEMKGEKMITIQELNDFGADTKEGIARCINNESFYLRMVNKAVEEFDKFDLLEAALRDGDLDAAFHHAHALKGLTGNLSLTPLYEPVSEITELLRTHTEMDYSALINTIMERKKAFLELYNS